MDYRHVLPEIALRRRPMAYLNERYETVEVPAQVGPPKFPETCPACGSALYLTLNNGWNGAAYECGATYSEKPQIQNHTDIWWGTCPQSRQ